jgi:hypothetical protein
MAGPRRLKEACDIDEGAKSRFSDVFPPHQIETPEEAETCRPTSKLYIEEIVHRAGYASCKKQVTSLVLTDERRAHETEVDRVCRSTWCRDCGSILEVPWKRGSGSRGRSSRMGEWDDAHSVEDCRVGRARADT